MTGLVQAAKKAFDESCRATVCKKENCSVTLEGAPEPHAIIDFDRPGSPFGRQDARCDYLFLADGKDGAPGWVVPMELSSGEKKPEKLEKQLQEGANIARNKLPAKAKTNFRPIFVGKWNKFLRTEMKKKPIRFHEKKELVRSIPCGGALKNVLKASK